MTMTMTMTTAIGAAMKATVRATPAALLRLFSLVLASSVLVSFGIARSAWMAGRANIHFNNALLVGGSLLGVAVLCGAGSWLMERSRKLADEQSLTLKAALVTLTVTSLWLPIPMYLALWKGPASDLIWVGYEFLDKRWLYVTYWLGILTLVIAPAATLAWVRGISRMEREISSFRGLNFWGGAIGLLVAWFLWGPPWHLANSTTGLELHEVVHLGPVQAIFKGFAPYSEAKTQYGPGVQWFTYAYMKQMGFSLLHLRETFAIYAYVFGSVALGLVGLLLPLGYSILAIAMTTVLSVQSLYGFDKDGVFEGFFGWANSGRSLGVLLLGVGIYFCFWFVRPSWRRDALAFVTGVIWAAFCWFAQENLSSGLAAGFLLGLVYCLSGSVGFSELLRGAGFVFAGFFTMVAVILFPQWQSGHLQGYLQAYFGVGSSIFAGFSNTRFWDPWNASWSKRYHLSPYLALGALLLGTYSRQARRIFAPMDASKALLVTAACVFLSSNQTSLLRADSAHFLSPAMALGLVIACMFRVLPDLAERLAWRRTIQLGLVLILLGVYLAPYNHVLKGRLQTPPPPQEPPASLAARRVGFTIPDYSWAIIWSSPPNYTQFIQFMDALHNEVNGRSVVVSSFPNCTSIPYFFADLVPAFPETELSHVFINTALLNEYRQRILADTRFGCLIAGDPSDPVLIALRNRPEFASKTLMLGTWPISVLCRSSASPSGSGS